MYVLGGERLDSVRSRDSHGIVLRVGREVEIWQLLHGERVSLVANGVSDYNREK